MGVKPDLRIFEMTKSSPDLSPWVKNIFPSSGPENNFQQIDMRKRKLF